MPAAASEVTASVVCESWFQVWRRRGSWMKAIVSFFVLVVFFVCLFGGEDEVVAGRVEWADGFVFFLARVWLSLLGWLAAQGASSPVA
ncbi:hypothetical protein B0I37DRAFT_380025, partial [Chaetomium sp. MPI-CAGE-AT-0009]